jgi:hypothetical protein
MLSVYVATIVFACTFGGALLGMALRTRLPAHHQDSDSKDVIKLVMGLIATIAALVLGLLIASARGDYETQQNEVQRLAVNIVELDRILTQLGPEAHEARGMLREMAAAQVERVWPTGKGAEPTTALQSSRGKPEALVASVANFEPRTAGQRYGQQRALQVLANMGETRLLLYEQAGNSLAWPFIVILVLWLVVLFVSFGFFGRRNGTVTAVLFVGALSVASALFLILEMSRPFAGLMQISSAPMRHALEALSR